MPLTCLQGNTDEGSSKQKTRATQGNEGLCQAGKYSEKKGKKLPSGLPQQGIKMLQRPKGTRAEESMNTGPFFYVGGRNGAPIVTAYCESKGWHRIYNKERDDYKLRWCEIKSKMAYNSFREGDQLLYQIPNNKVLTTKIGLLTTLREFDRVNSKVHHGQGLRRLKMVEFFPETFRMDVRDEREAFFAQLEDERRVGKSSVWICKPTGLNQGRGIFLLRADKDIEAFKSHQQTADGQHSHKKLPNRQPQARIVQRYIQNPLLLKGKKFDVRSYFLIACTSPYMVFFRHGYVRVTCDLYDPNSTDLTSHLTNQYMQKKNPLYGVLKEDTVWSMESLNVFLNRQHGGDKALPQDWVFGAFTRRMQQLSLHCFLAAKAKLERKLGYFDLIGCDFMIDENFKVWLLEMNCNPALQTNCQVLKEVVPAVVTETLDLTLEIFRKRQRGLPLLPLTSQMEFVLLYREDSSLAHAAATSRGHGPSQRAVRCPRVGLRGLPSSNTEAAKQPGRGDRQSVAGLCPPRPAQKHIKAYVPTSQSTPTISMVPHPTGCRRSSKPYTHGSNEDMDTARVQVCVGQE